MNKAYKYRLYPNSSQQEYFSGCFAAARFIWNKMLYDRMEYYKETGKSKTITPACYKAENPWLKKADSLALANVQLDLDRAYRAFFVVGSHRYTNKTIAKARRQGRELSFYDLEKHPKFKSKKDDTWRSYTTNNQNGTVAIIDKHKKTKIAKVHEKITNQRKDFLHKESDSITKGHDVVCVEDLDMKAMAQALNFGKSVSDNGWGMFTRFMEYKQGWRGHHFVKVERLFPSSKLCHVCGWKNDELTLSDREWDCKQCGTHHLRDQNAAINIMDRGLEILSARLAVQKAI